MSVDFVRRCFMQLPLVTGEATQDVLIIPLSIARWSFGHCSKKILELMMEKTKEFCISTISGMISSNINSKFTQNKPENIACNQKHLPRFYHSMIIVILLFLLITYQLHDRNSFSKNFSQTDSVTLCVDSCCYAG